MEEVEPGWGGGRLQRRELEKLPKEAWEGGKRVRGQGQRRGRQQDMRGRSWVMSEVTEQAKGGLGAKSD